MPRLPVLSGREIVNILHAEGFSTVGQRGSHMRLKKNSQIVIVPMHDEIPVGTLKSIIRQSALSESVFRNRKI